MTLTQIGWNSLPFCFADVEQSWEETHYHFIHSTDGAGTAIMLIDHQLSAGYPSEVDLFIAQAVLQYV